MFFSNSNLDPLVSTSIFKALSDIHSNLRIRKKLKSFLITLPMMTIDSVNIKFENGRLS